MILKTNHSKSGFWGWIWFHRTSLFHLWGGLSSTWSKSSSRSPKFILLDFAKLLLLPESAKPEIPLLIWAPLWIKMEIVLISPETYKHFRINGGFSLDVQITRLFSTNTEFLCIISPVMKAFSPTTTLLSSDTPTIFRLRGYRFRI